MKRSTALGTIILVSSLVSASVSTIVTSHLLGSHTTTEQQYISPEIKAKAEKAVEDSRDRMAKAEENFKKAVRQAEYAAKLPANGEEMCKPYGGVRKHDIMYFANIFVTYCKNDNFHFIQKNSLEGDS